MTGGQWVFVILGLGCMASVVAIVAVMAWAAGKRP